MHHPSYLLPLVDRQMIAHNTLALHLDIGGTGYTFRAGQYADITLINPPYRDENGDSRTFSFANPPGDGTLEIAMRLSSSAFKRSIAAIPLGSMLHVSHPMGFFGLHRDKTRPAVCIAGGIGVTPFLSLIGQALNDRCPYPIFLLYANRAPEYVAYLSQLEQLAKQSANFTFIPIVTATDDYVWRYEKGRINRSLLMRHISNFQESIYYLAGHTRMIEGIMNLLHNCSIPEASIKAEDFGDYKNGL